MALGYVRPAREADVADIAQVQFSTWRTAYPRFIPRFAVDEVDPDWLAERWGVAITDPPSARHRVLVAVEQAADQPERLVGFVAAGPADETALAPDETGDQEHTVAVTDLLVEPRWGRRGHGSRLLAAAVEHWRDDGFARAVAWAFEQDIATMRFLTSTGWATDGATRALDVAGVVVPQVRLHVALDPEPTGVTPVVDDTTPPASA